VSTALPLDRHSYDELALYVQQDGKLVDAYKVEYEIYDDSAGLPGTAIAPGDTRQDVTVEGNYATGCYGVYDHNTALPWVPNAEITNGRIVWYYQLVEDGEEYIAERRFEVLPPAVARHPAFNLFTAQDLIDMSLAMGTELEQAMAFNIATLWTERIERYCRQSFHPMRETRRLKWRPGAYLFLPTVLYGLESFTPYEDSALPNETLLVYGWPYDRQNPRIEMEPGERPDFGLIQYVPVSILGVWGYFNPDTYEAPADLTQTALITIAEYATEHLGAGAPIPGMGPLKREKTDGHEVEYAVISVAMRSGMIALLRSPELRDQLDLHRAPIALRMTGAG
jgi:hypothetical protein